jgi:hypothetical protein
MPSEMLQQFHSHEIVFTSSGRINFRYRFDREDGQLVVKGGDSLPLAGTLDRVRQAVSNGLRVVYQEREVTVVGEDLAYLDGSLVAVPREIVDYVD